MKHKHIYPQFLVSCFNESGWEFVTGITDIECFTNTAKLMLDQYPDSFEIRFKKIQYDHELEGRKRLQ